MKYGDSHFARKAFLFYLFFAAICMARPALAIERHAAVPLPDEMLGSKAHAVARAAGGSYGVVGSQKKSDGTIAGMYWGVVADPSDPSGNTVYATELPKMPGWNAEATGIAFMEGDPDRPIIVGIQRGALVDTSPIHLAVLWRRDASGQFTNTTLDDEAVESQANAIIIRDTPLGLIIVVCGKFRLPDGNWHACVWQISAGGINRTDLGTPGGPNSEAMAVAFRDDLFSYDVVGSGQRPNGQWVATCWQARLTQEEGIFYFLRVLPTPPGAESHAYYIGSANGGIWRIAGDVTEPNGRRSASIWINQGEIPGAFFLEALYRDALGRRNSTARGIVDYIDDDDISTTLAVGTAWNTTDDRTGMGVLSNNRNPRNPLVFDFDSLRMTGSVGVNETFTAGLNAVGPGGAIAGEGNPYGSMTAQAMLFLPTNVEVPQKVNFLIGNEFGDILNLWQEDAGALRIAPIREGRVQSILAEWTSGRFFDASPREPQKLTLVSRVRPRHPNAAPLTLSLQLYDSVYAVWVTVGIRMVAQDGIFNRLVIEIPDPERFAVPVGEPLRWRLGLRGEEWRDFGVDLFEVEVRRLL